METLPNLQKELAQEYAITRKFIDLFPEGKNEYAPHEKSMPLMPLATHVVEIVGWPDFISKTEKLDFAAGDYNPPKLETKEDLQNLLEKSYQASRESLAQMTEAGLNGRWTMHLGDQLLADYNKYEAMRHALSQLIHHRAQLGVYYRLNNIPVPASYGPSADEQHF
jgi:uncharacterized damage-inducible protein DinB